MTEIHARAVDHQKIAINNDREFQNNFKWSPYVRMSMQCRNNISWFCDAAAAANLFSFVCRFGKSII